MIHSWSRDHLPSMFSSCNNIELASLTKSMLPRHTSFSKSLHIPAAFRHKGKDWEVGLGKERGVERKEDKSEKNGKGTRDMEGRRREK